MKFGSYRPEEKHKGQPWMSTPKMKPPPTPYSPCPPPMRALGPLPAGTRPRATPRPRTCYGTCTLRPAPALGSPIPASSLENNELV